MPQLIVRYSRNLPRDDQLLALGQVLRPLVAEAASTEEVILTEEAVDWLPYAHEPGAIAPKFSIELRTIGYPARKLKLDDAGAKQLKSKMLEAGLNQFVSADDAFLWVQFVDQDGPHV